MSMERTVLMQNSCYSKEGETIYIDEQKLSNG